jgi:hypothetical protein
MGAFPTLRTKHKGNADSADRADLRGSAGEQVKAEWQWGQKMPEFRELSVGVSVQHADAIAQP